MTLIEGLVLAHPLWAWLAVAAVFLSAELVTGSGWLLWPAASAALVAVLTLVLPLPASRDIIAFALITIVATFLGRRFMPRRALSGDDVNEAAGRLIGHKGRVASGFEAGAGRVFVDGKEWSAELEGQVPVDPGGEVEVTALIGGARLRVRALAALRGEP
jgi:membrane protein implicated in regulation of membrane protease activity